MAERIVSPGVFTRENDLSFLPQGIGEIGAALIGQTLKGPAFVPTQVSSFSEFQQKFGGLTQDSYLPYTAQSYLEEAGVATIVRVLGTGGYTLEDPLVLTLSSSAGERVAAVLHPSTQYTDMTNAFDKSFVRNLDGSATPASGSSFILNLSGSGQSSVASTTSSMNPTSDNYFTKTYGYMAKSSKNAYTYLNFKSFQSQSFATGESVVVSTASFANTAFTNDYQSASTPWIKSQKVGGTATNLFKVHTLSHGVATNYEHKVVIRDVRPASDIPGSEYGTFTLQLRRVDTTNIPYSIFGQNVVDSDIRPIIVEEYTNLNLDPSSPNYIKRVIGDRYITVESNGDLSWNGDYDNASNHIRIEVTDDVDNGAIDSTLVPFGFGAVTSPLQSGYTMPEPTYVVSQSLGGIYNGKVVMGYSFDFATTDNLNFLNPIPASSTQVVGNDFDLATCNSGSTTISLSTSNISYKKFGVPFQGGFDGYQPNRVVNMGDSISAANTQGFNLSSATAAGTVAYRRAINTISNPEEFDINLLVLPGVINRLHSFVTTYAKDMCEDRQDVFYIMDGGAYSDTPQVVVNSLSSFDSNYVATYHPWVQILDTDRNKPIWVPPSVVIPGVIAFNDSVSEEWYAPAGFTRGGLPNVRNLQKRYKRVDNDLLYENRINPIVHIVGQGISVSGQKTLQARPSALDRVNVRRLLIALKKFIASSSRYLVFEQNTAATRNRFLSIVEPYLESVQQRQGLESFQVKMDSDNNTPDIIDRNILVGEIWIKPTRTVEYIIIDFNILPTGASFPGS